MPAMTTAADWSRAADSARRIGHAVEFHAQIGSTNDRARDLLAGSPDGEGVAVVADLQTAGRGRRGRAWLSPPGVNLMASVGFRPAIATELTSLLGLSVGLALRSACSSALPATVDLQIRWPNDLVDAAGRKVAGVLIETVLAGGRLAEAIVGMGINANWRRHEMPAEIAAVATSLCELAGGPVDRLALLERLLDALDAEIRALERGASPILRARGVSWLDGRSVELDLGERLLAGRVAGLGDDGSLLLDAAHGRMALPMGEVVRVINAIPVGVAS
jgi:BirA family transcriptional regulator, biotin operon repressor / biotin---[acetyl-CoA-carboxylase] ligase